MTPRPSRLSRRTRPTALVLGAVLAATALGGCGGGDDAPVIGTVIDDLSGGTSTTIIFDGAFGTDLSDAGVTVTAAGTAELTGGVGTFPLTGGWLDLFDPAEVSPAVFGRLQHRGSGITFAQKRVTLTLGNFDVDPGRSLVYADVVVNGQVATYATPVFDLDPATLQTPRMEGTDVVLEGSAVQLTNSGAILLDQTFGTDFGDATAVGVSTSTVAVGG